VHVWSSTFDIRKEAPAPITEAGAAGPFPLAVRSIAGRLRHVDCSRAGAAA